MTRAGDSGRNLLRKLSRPVFKAASVGLPALCLLAGCRPFAPRERPSPAPPPMLTYGPSAKHTRYFGQWLLPDEKTDKPVMFLTICSSIVKGKPSNRTPGDDGTYNAPCKTWWADRIWMVPHSGDGKTPGEWGTPELALTIGGRGEEALVGDPSVVRWKGKWHMFYEGTDCPDGNQNLIFHATAADLNGPWTKQGRVDGLLGDVRGSGLSWPTVLIHKGDLYLYYTDGSARLLCARASSADASRFEQILEPGSQDSKPLVVVPGEWVNRAQVFSKDGRFVLVYDADRRTRIKASTAASPFSFPKGEVLHAAASGNDWETLRIGLPCHYRTNGEDRIYYTGEAEDPKDGVLGGGLGVLIPNL